jgi:autotransporter-associated beta strand protein
MPRISVIRCAGTLALVLIGLGWMFSVQPAYAATHTWTGGFGESGDWSAAANWSPAVGVVDGETVDLVFPANFRGLRSSNNDRNNVTVNSITFRDGGFTISGKAVTLTGTLGSSTISSCTSTTTLCTSSEPNTVGLPMTLSGLPTMTVGTSVTDDGPAPLLILSGMLSGSALRKDGAGTLQLQGNNSFAGNTSIFGGRLNVGSAGALGTTGFGTVVSSGTTLAVNSGVAVGGEPLSLNGGTLEGDSGASWGGPITLGANSTVSVPADTFTVSGTVDNAHVLAKIGWGTLKTTGVVGGTQPPSRLDLQSGSLDLANSMTAGETDVAAGTTVLASGGTLTSPLRLGGTLVGADEIAWTGAVTLTNDSTISVPDGTFTLHSPLDGGFFLGKTGNGVLVAGAVGQGVPLSGLSVGGGHLSISQGLTTTSGTTVFNNSALILAATSRTPLTVQNSLVVVSSPATLTVPTGLGLTGAAINGTGILALNSDVTVNASTTPSSIAAAVSLQAANPTFTVADGAADPDLLISGTVSNGSGASGLVKAGLGAMKLTSDNAYSGTTTIDDGTLLIEGRQTSSAVVLKNGVLAGPGSVGAITATSGTVSPGDPIGSLNSLGDVKLAGGTLAVELNGTTGADYDWLNAFGSVDLTGGWLIVSLKAGFTPAVGSSFTIIPDHGGGLTGAFNGLPEGTVFPMGGASFRITYGSTGNRNVVLTVVPSVSIADASVTEGNGGTTNAVFTVSLSDASVSTITVLATTADGTALAGQDYQATQQTITFTPGQISQHFSVPILGDRDIESDETFTVRLTSPTNATIGKAPATGTILDDDAPTPAPTATPTATLMPTATATLAPTMTPTPTGDPGPLPGPGGTTPTPTFTPAATPTPPPVSVQVSRAGSNRLAVTIAALGTLQRVEWTPTPNLSVEDANGRPIAGNAISLPPNSKQVTFYVRRLGGGSATLTLTVTGSFGIWHTFVGGGPDAW